MNGFWRRCQRSAIVLSAVLAAGLQIAAAQTPAESPPATQPAATQPATQPATVPAIEDEKTEAQLVQELAEEALEEAKTELESVRQEKERTQAHPPDRRAARDKPVEEAAGPERLITDEAAAERKVRLLELRAEYGAQRGAVVARREEIEPLRAEVEAAVAQTAALTPERRTELAEGYEQRAAQLRQSARQLWEEAGQARAPVAELLQQQQRLKELRDATPAEAPAQARIREALEQLQQLIDNHRLIAYAIGDMAVADWQLADAYATAAEALRAANRAFWVQHAYLVNSGRIVLLAIALHVGLNVAGWLIAWLVARGAAGRRHGYATPTVKRVNTLIQFARSIAKLLVWVFAIVSVLAEFGIHPGQSAGALGVIGLVLAGMFQQLVVDFVKGIDIAIGGHYFVGDFIQVGAHSGHVLDFTVKYTVLRTPSGQVITMPNSQCIPSRRFPSGYVDNYVDIPLASGADTATARRELDAVGAQLNARIEAVKRAPEIVDRFHSGGRITLRVQVRVLPTCDWVITQHYLPMMKERLAAAGVELAGEPQWIFINDVPTFRRLFSRKMTDREIRETLAAETRPTIEREEPSDPQRPPAGGATGPG